MHAIKRIEGGTRMKYLFKNALTVTMNQDMNVLESCDVLVDNGIIASVGSVSDEQMKKAVVIDA